MGIIYFIIIITAVLAFVLTPLVIKFAVAKGFVDVPKDNRRVHLKPMPRIGGLAIVSSMFIAFLIYYLITKDIPSISLNNQFVGYILGGLTIFAMGIIDDVFDLRARNKAIFQIAAAIILCAFGVVIDTAKIPFIHTDLIDLGIFSIPLTMIWIIGITNAVNLIDGLDGLAAGISSISSLALLIIFITTSASLEAILITAVLFGATVGFLPYNFNPAKTFMGDVGSNFLGFTLATVSILGLAKGYTMIAIVAPLLVLGVPIFDTLFAMGRRALAGKPLLKPDGAHIHHRLLKKGFNQKQAVIILYTITSILCIFAVLVISADIYKLILLIVATIFFIILGYITTIKKRMSEEESIKELNSVLSMKKQNKFMDKFKFKKSKTK